MKKYHQLIKEESWNQLSYLITLGRAFEKKSSCRTRKKQIKALEVLKNNTQKLTIKGVIPES